MAVVQSLGSLVDVQTVDWYPTLAYGSLTFYNQLSYDYATLYRDQPNVRTCVDFLARNIAQLGLHVFRRVSETDRERLRDHPLTQVLDQPLPAEFKVTRYRLIESLIADLGVYFNGFWLKVRRNGDGPPVGLLRIPPVYVAVHGSLVPTSYEIEFSDRRLEIPPDQMVHFRGYNAESAVTGLSPLETLRRVLAEEHAAGDYREYFWRNAARMGGVITRPKDAPEWSSAARERFKSEFEQLYSGTANSGRTAILEEGMEWKSMTFTAQESEYLAGRKLTREECARAYHIPLPMVGILDHATFSNIREQHKQLYQDCLGPWLAMIEEDIALQLLPDFENTAAVYCEFNIQEKLQGSFEEQTSALQSAVGRPWMTANEARARMNMRSMVGDAEQLVTPLNVLVGGQASPQDVEGRPPEGEPGPNVAAFDITRGSVDRFPADGVKARGDIDPTLPRVRGTHEARWREVLSAIFKRQQDATLGHIPARQRVDIELIWDMARWNRELFEDLLRLNMATALVWARDVAQKTGQELDEDVMLEWLREHSRVQAEYINSITRDQLADALTQDEPRSAARDVFALAIAARAAQIAVSAVTTASNFGSQDAARQSGLQWKQWQVNSKNPRPTHEAMNGERVGLRERFSNGGLWPGDPALGADEVANCMCSVRFGR